MRPESGAAWAWAGLEEGRRGDDDERSWGAASFVSASRGAPDRNDAPPAYAWTSCGPGFTRRGSPSASGGTRAPSTSTSSAFVWAGVMRIASTNARLQRLASFAASSVLGGRLSRRPRPAFVRSREIRAPRRHRGNRPWRARCRQGVASECAAKSFWRPSGRLSRGGPCLPCRVHAPFRTCADGRRGQSRYQGAAQMVRRRQPFDVIVAPSWCCPAACVGLSSPSRCRAVRGDDDRDSPKVRAAEGSSWRRGTVLVVALGVAMALALGNTVAEGAAIGRRKRSPSVATDDADRDRHTGSERPPCDPDEERPFGEMATEGVDADAGVGAAAHRVKTHRRRKKVLPCSPSRRRCVGRGGRHETATGVSWNCSGHASATRALWKRVSTSRSTPANHASTAAEASRSRSMARGGAL